MIKYIMACRLVILFLTILFLKKSKILTIIKGSQIPILD